MSNTSKVFFVKSLEEDFHTKTLKRTKKVNFQSISDIIKTKRILLNTKSFGRKRRLSTTILSDHYLKTYRPQGIIFQTEQKPEYVLPCDIVLLSMADKIVVHYYRIKNNLHTYYNHQLIGGFERFIFKDFNSMIKKFRSPDSVWSAVNTFRKKAGYPILHREKHRGPGGNGGAARLAPGRSVPQPRTALPGNHRRRHLARARVPLLRCPKTVG